jgi:hypothetical protein
MRLFQRNLIQLPIDNSFGLAFPIVQYIDDTLIIMLEEARQLFTFECLLHTFAVSTGLKVNFNKCYIVPLKVVEQKVNILVGTLGCLVESLTFTYLGLPLGTTKPVIQEFLPLPSRIERSLMGISPLTSLQSSRPFVT